MLLKLACSSLLYEPNFSSTVHLVAKEASLQLALKISTKTANDNVQSGDHGEEEYERGSEVGSKVQWGQNSRYR